MNDPVVYYSKVRIERVKGLGVGLTCQRNNDRCTSPCIRRSPSTTEWIWRLSILTRPHWTTSSRQRPDD
jgi:hypothetical protein